MGLLLSFMCKKINTNLYRMELLMGLYKAYVMNWSIKGREGRYWLCLSWLCLSPSIEEEAERKGFVKTA